MSKELQENFSQLLLPDFVVGPGEISESIWTEFAQTHEVKISVHPIIHRSRRGIRPGRKTYLISNDHMFMKENVWNIFVEKNQIYKLSIHEYKKLDKHGARPFWAKTFFERKMSDKGKYKILESGQTEHGRFWSVEQESIDPKEPEAKVLRYKNMGGNCRRVIVVYPSTSGNFNVRKEDWISKGVWSVISDGQLSKNEVGKLFINS
jgi:hypothetical protein